MVRWEGRPGPRTLVWMTARVIPVGSLKCYPPVLSGPRGTWALLCRTTVAGVVLQEVWQTMLQITLGPLLGRCMPVVFPLAYIRL